LRWVWRFGLRSPCPAAHTPEIRVIAFGDHAQKVDDGLGHRDLVRRRGASDTLGRRRRATAASGSRDAERRRARLPAQLDGTRAKVLRRDEPLASIMKEALEGYAKGRFQKTYNLIAYL